MYKLKLVDNTDQEIIDFEERRLKGFGVVTKLNSIYDSAYGRTIKDGDALAFNCLDDNNEKIGGMLITTMFGDIYLDRLFVDEKHRGKAAGKFMVKYVEEHQDFFNDYFGFDAHGILLEPTDKTVDYYLAMGFDYSGYQMYKRY